MLVGLAEHEVPMLGLSGNYFRAIGVFLGGGFLLKLEARSGLLRDLPIEEWITFLTFAQKHTQIALSVILPLAKTLKM